MFKYYQSAIFFVCLTAFFSCKKTGEPVPGLNAPLEIRAVDISLLPEVRQSGLGFYNSRNQQEDMLNTLKNAGVNMVRLRLWKDPSWTVSGFSTVKNLAAEARALGLKILLSVHYSDTWADPGQQEKPVIWRSIPLVQLKDSVYAYTKKIMQEISPDMIQIGNEINGGFLWPEGSSSNTAQMKDLIGSATRAVRETNAATRILIHFAGHDQAYSFFSSLYGLDYDIIGLSYYPYWHGKDLDALQNSIVALKNGFAKKVMIVETAYPFTLGYNDFTNNIIGSNAQLIPAYSASAAGQEEFLTALIDKLKQVNALGFCYWGGEWVSYKGPVATNASSWENQALWDFNGHVLPALNAFK